MASLSFAWQMIHDPSHETFRRQVEVGMWSVARDLHVGGIPEGPGKNLVTRVLRGDDYPIQVAIWAASTDFTVQDAYISAGNKFSDQAVLNWLEAAWSALAGV